MAADAPRATDRERDLRHADAKSSRASTRDDLPFRHLVRERNHWARPFSGKAAAAVNATAAVAAAGTGDGSEMAAAAESLPPSHREGEIHERSCDCGTGFTGRRQGLEINGRLLLRQTFRQFMGFPPGPEP